MSRIQFVDWEEIVKIVLAVIGVFLLWAAIISALAWPIRLLWNWLMPIIFNLPALSYWQAWGMEALICLLLGARLPKITIKENRY